MSTDVIFFLKSTPGKSAQLPWPDPNTKLIGLDPGSLSCTGVDRLCSTAYSRMWSTYGGPQGRFVETMLKKHGVTNPGRVAFVGYSASHGLLNPLANNDADRARISAYVLLDASFGGGKSGYVKFVKDAAQNKRMLVTTTSNTGGDDSWGPVWDQAEAELGEESRATEARAPVPQPSGGAWQLGKLAYYLRYVDQKGNTELPHWEMGKVQTPLVQAYLLAYWQGKLGGFPWGKALGAAIAAGGLYYGYRAWRS